MLISYSKVAIESKCVNKFRLILFIINPVAQIIHQEGKKFRCERNSTIDSL